MSLRPEIYGFRFATMEALLGSGDQALLLKLKAKAKELYGDDPATLGEVCAILKRAIDEGTPFEDLEDEGPAHIWAAHLLAGEGQELWDSGSSSWKVQPAEILFDDGAKLSARGNELIELLLGRALFGESIESDWATYAWLTNAEVKELAAELSGEATAGLQNDAIAKLIHEFRGWLAEIDKRGLDLWYLAN